MLKKLLVAFVSVGLTVSAFSAEAEMRIGFVNGQRLINESPQAVKAKKKLEKDFEKRDQELQRIAKQLQGMQENMEKNGPTMPETERRNKEREFNDLNRDFQRKQREFREDLNLRQNEEMAAIYENINKVIRKVAETEKFDLILQEAVYFSPKIDITEKVLKSLGDGAK
jgi:outer membrane protein